MSGIWFSLNLGLRVISLTVSSYLIHFCPFPQSHLTKGKDIVKNS